MATLGAHIRKRREDLGLSLTQVQLKSGGAVNSSTLSKIENGRRNAGPEILLALAPVLKMDVQELYRLAGYLPREGSEQLVIADVGEGEDPLVALDRLLKRNGVDSERRRAVRAIVRDVLSQAKGSD